MRVLLSGYYGFGNLGDDALLSVIVSQLRTRFPYLEIDVLSATPEQTAHELRVDATQRKNPSAIRSAIERADVLVSGGGGLLQNATSLRSLLYYTGIVHQATKMRRKTMIFAQSIGPLDIFGRYVVREACKGVTVATVRDARSKALLSSLIPGTPIEQTADPVFLYDAPENAPDLSIEGLGPQSEPYAIISVRKTAGFRQGIEAIARAVDRLQSHGIRSAFLPLGGAADADVSTQVIRACSSSPLMLPECDLHRTATIVSRAHVLIGMRLHALIFAARYAVPFLSIPYDPKVQSLCDDLAYPMRALWQPGKPAPAVTDVDDLVDGLIAQRAALSAHLETRVADVRASAGRNFDVLGELLH